ncbi:hypothetical protein GBZ26_08215 [Azospirillum formosense]|uniref:Uncharacterized protein n=1 Tax=Azospirillum formosense TaxID=861533 RepID=A0ABX2KST9_9PROT|nr:hypothetical protein [Azospirillum formosense]MBY3756731.1 hypothetical protein [Azospirillum formosense]NUB19195.1 hypothetical protein [Azospirillum formosense]
MNDPLTIAYISLAVLVSVLIGIGVLAVLTWRGVHRSIARISERMEARRAEFDRGAGLTGHRLPL